jgi:predicted peptidase
LHGQIVEGSDGLPKHPQHGVYQYPKIVESLDKEGFWVISEIREKNTDPSAYADNLVWAVTELKKAGVPSSRITIVGGSKGGVIACYASNKLQDPDLNVVIMAGFFDRLRKDPKMNVYGRVLSIHDSSDQSGINPKYFLKESKGVSEQRIVITEKGWGHSLIFQPRKEWLDEVVAWSGINAD